MCLYFTIHNGYLLDPDDENHIIPIEKIRRAWACKGSSYCCFLVKEKDKPDLIGTIALSVGVAFRQINHPDFALYHQNGFVNFRFVETFHTHKTDRQTIKFKLFDDVKIYETSIRKTILFDKLYKNFLLRKALKEENI